MQNYQLSINGNVYKITEDTASSLLDVLRNQLGFVGTRQGCGLEQCGACRVLIDGKPEYACTFKAEAANGTSVETIESTAPDLKALKSSFLSYNAGQCGYCLSGILMTSVAHLRTTESPNRETVQSALREHLCRCGAHNRIINAVLDAADE